MNLETALDDLNDDFNELIEKHKKTLDIKQFSACILPTILTIIVQGAPSKTAAMSFISLCIDRAFEGSNQQTNKEEEDD